MATKKVKEKIKTNCNANLKPAINEVSQTPANFADEFMGRIERIAEEAKEFHEAQKKKIDELLDTYGSKLQKFRDEFENKTQEGFKQINSRIMPVTRGDLDVIVKKLNTIERKLNKVSKNA